MCYDSSFRILHYISFFCISSFCISSFFASSFFVSSSSSYIIHASRPLSLRSFARCFLMQALKSTKLFKKYCKNWSVLQKRSFCQNGLSWSLAKRGKPLYQVGRPSKQAYLVMRGILEVRSDRRTATGRRSGQLGVQKDIIAVGEMAGELALQGVGSRTKTCVAQVGTQVLVINVATYLTIAQRAPSFKDRYSLLRKASIMTDWPIDRMFWLAFNWEEKKYEKGNIITEFEEIPQSIKIVMEGSVGIYAPGKDDKDKAINKGSRRAHCKLVSVLGPGEMFDGVGLLATAAKLMKTAALREAARSPVQIVSETLNLKVLELPSSMYDLILQSGLPTVERIYTLEVKRATLYQSGIMGWNASMSFLDQQKNNNKHVVKQFKLGKIKRKDKQEEQQRKRSPSMDSHNLLVVELVTASESMEGNYEEGGRRSHLNLGSRLGFSQKKRRNVAALVPQVIRAKPLQGQGKILRRINSSPQPPRSGNTIMDEQILQLADTTLSVAHEEHDCTMHANTMTSPAPSSQRHVHGGTPPKNKTWWKDQNLFTSPHTTKKRRAVLSNPTQQPMLFQHRASSFAKPFTQRLPSRSDVLKAQQALREKSPAW